MGAILFIIRFVFPWVFPSVEQYINTLSDTVIYFLTPVLVMFVLNKEILNLYQKPAGTTEKLNVILTELDELSLNYGIEAFEAKKMELRAKILALYEP
jgi:hypothetical protein